MCQLPTGLQQNFRRRFDPALLKRYDEQVARIHLAESSREHVDVKLIPVYSSNP